MTVLERSFDIARPRGVDCVAADNASLPVVSVSAAWELPAGSEAVLEVVDSLGFRDSVALHDLAAASPWSQHVLFPLDAEVMTAGGSANVTLRLTVRHPGARCTDAAAVAIGSVRLHSVHVA